jgi:hypothetical protein
MGEAMNEFLSEEEMLRKWRAEEVRPEVPRDLAERIWTEIGPRLEPYRKSKRAWWLAVWTKPVVAIAAAILLTLSFAGGRLWERAHSPKNSGIGSGVLAQSTAERILLTATADHLGRSERFLVELRMSRGVRPELAKTARELLEDNRLYQQSAVYANDTTMADVLDRLGRVLAEVADGEQGNDAVPAMTAGDFRLDELERAIRAEQRRSPVRM